MILDLNKPHWNPSAAMSKLDGYQSNLRSELEEQFSEVFPNVRAALDRKIPVKYILEGLRAGGMVLTPAKLKRLLRRESERRGEVAPESRNGRRNGAAGKKAVQVGSTAESGGECE